MSILPEHQGKGSGSELLEAMIGEARARRMNLALAGAQGKLRTQRRVQAPHQTD